jgi:hypothetical protein
MNLSRIVLEYDKSDKDSEDTPERRDIIITFDHIQFADDKPYPREVILAAETYKMYRDRLLENR